jgi:hypothetical protein
VLWVCLFYFISFHCLLYCILFCAICFLLFILFIFVFSHVILILILFTFFCLCCFIYFILFYFILFILLHFPAKIVARWCKAIPSESLEYFALNMPVEPWKEVCIYIYMCVCDGCLCFFFN